MIGIPDWLKKAYFYVNVLKNICEKKLSNVFKHEDKEYSDYCIIWKGDMDVNGFKNWKNNIICKHKNNNDILILKKVLDIGKRSYKKKAQMISVIYLPVVVMFISILISISTIYITKYQIIDSFQSQLDDALHRSQEKALGNHIESPQFEVRLKNLTKFFNKLSGTTIIIMILAIIPGGILLGKYNRSLKKIDFYTDYIRIIDEIIANEI